MYSCFNTKRINRRATTIYSKTGFRLFQSLLATTGLATAVGGLGISERTAGDGVIGTANALVVFHQYSSELLTLHTLTTTCAPGKSGVSDHLLGVAQAENTIFLVTSRTSSGSSIHLRIPPVPSVK